MMRRTIINKQQSGIRKWSAPAFDSAAFLKEKFRTIPWNPLFRKQAVKLTRERLFNGYLARKCARRFLWRRFFAG
jgi:hypothetical protein